MNRHRKTFIRYDAISSVSSNAGTCLCGTSATGTQKALNASMLNASIHALFSVIRYVTAGVERVKI